MKVLVLGGGGFIGSTICDRLLRDGHHLRIFERPRVDPYRVFLALESVEWIHGEYSSRADLSSAVRGTDAVIHLISTTLPKSSNDDPAWDVESNVIPSLNLLAEMAAHDVEKIVFISSGGTVYGVPQALPIDERHPTDPLCSYGISKLMIEKHLLMQCRLRGMRPVVLRVANPYGERQRLETAQGAVAAFVRKCLSGSPIEVWGDGSIVRDYIHVADVAEAFARALAYEGEHRVFNVSSGIGVSLNELIALISEISGLSPDVSYLKGRPFDVPVSILDNTLAQERLGWSPRIGIRDGLARTIAWFRQAP